MHELFAQSLFFFFSLLSKTTISSSSLCDETRFCPPKDTEKVLHFRKQYLNLSNQTIYALYSA